ncbi:MAG: metal ABC transporter solute-binding protein, Zn/Mn family [Phycisphaerae bacterium]
MGSVSLGSIAMGGLAVGFLAVGAAAIAGLRGTPASLAGEDPALSVAVSIPPQAWLVRRIAGTRVGVTTMLPAGNDPHAYQPADVQVSRAMRSAIYFRIGVPFEEGRWFRSIARSGRTQVVDLREGIPLRPTRGDAAKPDSAGHEHEYEHEHEHAFGLDPHIWLSPPLLKRQAATIADALQKADSEGVAVYRRGLASLLESLDVLDRSLRTKLKAHKGRTFLVFHPTWGYFAREYGLRQVAIEREGKEPSDHRITELRRLAIAEGIGVVFVQPQIKSRAARAIAASIGGRVHTLDPLAEDVAASLLELADAIAASYGND